MLCHACLKGRGKEGRVYIHPGVKAVETQYGLKLLLLFFGFFFILVIEKFFFFFLFPRIIHPILVPLVSLSLP